MYFDIFIMSSCFCNPLNDPNNNCTRPYINETDLFMAGLRAWLEYNPVSNNRYGNTGDPRTANKHKLYRYRTFGKDAAIFMLDTRSFRDAPVAIVSDLIPITAYAQIFTIPFQTRFCLKFLRNYWPISRTPRYLRRI